MSAPLVVDIAVIGAGSAGLSVAAGAAQLGVSTVLVERHLMGGDCLNTGCVPSKALLAAAKMAAIGPRAGAMGISYGAPVIDFAAVQAHVRGVIAALAPNDSVARFTGLGVTVIEGSACFVSPDEIAVGDRRIRARRFVIATGSRAAVPPIPGLADVPFLTNETIFSTDGLPAHLIVIGGGPIGLEMAQAHRRLGSRVTVLEAGSILPKDDPEAVDVVRRRLVGEGVELREGAKVAAVAVSGAGGIAVTVDGLGGTHQVDGSHVLVAAGRRPVLADLALDKAGIEASPGGIVVDQRLRTSNRRVFAIGDVAGGPQFTHVAGYHAGIVIRNALFRLPAKVDYRALPWVTYTDPELAQVGMTEAVARAAHGDDLAILRWPYHENDRAQTTRETEGLIKVVTRRNGRILGATIVGAEAGELIQTWILAIGQGLKISTIAGMIAPYPTLGEISKRAAGSYYTPKLFSARTKRLVRFLARFG